MLKQLRGFETYIWDWNGTLLDDIDIVIDCITAQLTRYGLPVPTPEKYKEVFGFPVSKYYERLGFGSDPKVFQEISDEFALEFNQRIPQAQLFPGVIEILTELKQSGAKNYVLSAAAQEHLDRVVPYFKIDHLFEALYGLPHTKADSKVQRGLQLIEEQRIDRSKTLLIGDTDHDLEVGQKLGVEVLLIADGHQNYSRLRHLHANVLETRF